MMGKSICLAKWGMGLGLLYIAWRLDTPLFMKMRMLGLPVLLTAWAMLGGAALWISLRKKRNRFQLWERLALAALIFGIGGGIALNPLWLAQGQRRVLSTPAAELQYLGRCFIVGYRDFETIAQLVRHGAIGGVYITRRNVKGKTMEQIRQEIAALQRIQHASGLPPLIVAADQEGGIVSSLSPPLKRLPPLADLAQQAENLWELDQQVIAYAADQARELASIGVNLNLSPVVDLKNETLNDANTIKTQISKRAIADNSRMIARIAAIYCRVMQKYGVQTTLKHFPGLGQVAEETHFVAGTLAQSPEYLEQNDWLPFRTVLNHADPFMMLGHVKVTAVDPEYPASLSETVIQTIIRQKWNHDGVLITDDLNMGAVYKRRGGIGQAAVQALNAGVDLLLISYDGDQYYQAMNEVIQAWRNNRLNRSRLAQSHLRLNRALPERYGADWLDLAAMR